MFQTSLSTEVRPLFGCLLSDGPEFLSKLSAFFGCDGEGRDPLDLPCSTPLVSTQEARKTQRCEWFRARPLIDMNS